MASSSSHYYSCDSSPDPSSSQSCDYDVFLSFRGKDTRNTFVDHLYAALCQHGIHTFKDDERLDTGESISPQLLEAIEHSQSVIIVFSKNYASSSWCLDELVKIMDCKDPKRSVVFPVFYDVDPYEVRRQSGTFGEGFAKAAGRNVDKVDVWRKALHGAGSLSGYDLRNTADGRESECIKTVVKWCFSHSCTISAIDEDLIGMRSRVKDLLLLLARNVDDVRMIGIWGMGGTGKTTLATVTFHEVRNQFDGASFISNVREKSKRIDGLQLLQKEILSKILRDKDLEVDGVLGKEMIKQRLGHKKVLIVLDDVDDVEQLSALAANHKWFGKGSRILITTRNAHVLKVFKVNEIHGVDLLTQGEAIQLFCRYALKSDSSTEEYSELSLQFVRYAGRLPLALKILGSFLYGRDTDEWTSALERLKNNPEGKIMKVLQISFDGLAPLEKEIFLDIACFFKGCDKDRVIRMLDSCKFHSRIGIDVLVEKALISISNYQTIRMHDLLQEMGRNIGKQSRLWDDEDINNALHTGTEAIEAIVGRWDYPPRLDGHTSNCDSKIFMSMKKLRLLYLYTYAPFVGGPGHDLPIELQCLTWEYYPYESLAESFQAPKLVRLEMPCSHIVQLWNGKKLLDKLKFLDLSYSYNLIRTPDFSDIPNLIELNLRNCTSLIEVHPSLGHLQKLVKLHLGGCKNLVEFPPKIHVKFLEILNFGGCYKFKRFPELVGNNDRLWTLELRSTAIESLPLSIANLTKLVRIDLNYCKNLLDLPDTICTFKNLGTMSLYGCTKLKKLTHVSLSGCCRLILDDSMMTHIRSSLKVKDLSYRASLSDHQGSPIDVGHLSFLEKLDLSSNPFASFPFIISQLPRLKSLNLSKCRNLKALPELPSSIAILIADECTSLESIESLSAGKYEWLWKVSLRGCESLTMPEQEKSSITGRLAKRYKLDHLIGEKHYKKLPLLQSMLLRKNVVSNHRFDILYFEESVDRAIPQWFRNDGRKGNVFNLELPQDWQKTIIGFAMCAVVEYSFFSFRLGINLSKRGWQIPGLHVKLTRLPAEHAQSMAELAQSPVDDRYNDVWIGYISLEMLRRSIERESMTLWTDWMDRSTILFLTFSSDDACIKSCAARVVYRGEVEHSEATPLSSSLQQQYDPAFAANTVLSFKNQVPATGSFGIDGITTVLNKKSHIL